MAANPADTEVFADRDTVFTNLGSYGEDCFYIRGRNDAKGMSAQDVQWRIRAPWPSTVYLDMWAGQDSMGFKNWKDRPLWEQASETGVTFDHSTSSSKVFTRNFSVADDIELYGNGASDGTGTYLVFVCPRYISDETKLPSLASDQVLGVVGVHSQAVLSLLLMNGPKPASNAQHPKP